jgi:hypothetical protein
LLASLVAVVLCKFSYDKKIRRHNHAYAHIPDAEDGVEMARQAAAATEGRRRPQ